MMLEIYLPLKSCIISVRRHLELNLLVMNYQLHYIDNGHFLTPYLLSTVSAYIVILLYMLSMVNFSSSTMVLILPLKYCQLT